MLPKARQEDTDWIPYPTPLLGWGMPSQVPFLIIGIQFLIIGIKFFFSAITFQSYETKQDNLDVISY